MNASGPLHKRFLQLAAFVFVVTTAYSQAVPKYDATTETTFKGTVAELKLVPPTGAKPVAYLMTKIAGDKDSVPVFLCPKKFLDDMGVSFKADDAIQVTGSKVKQDGADLVLAREVVKDGETLTLRFQDGKPAW
jgi:hypothetical protein